MSEMLLKINFPYSGQEYLGLRLLWLEFGVGKHLIFIPDNKIANSFRPQTSTAYL